jgi:DNA-directed RNA polymerase specialized sigma24 family protein
MNAQSVLSGRAGVVLNAAPLALRSRIHRFGEGSGKVTSSVGWSLTERALQRLLDRLGPDRDAAGRVYQGLRDRLVDYFDWKGAQRPEVAADETLDRVARRLDEGEPVERVEAYAFGVARLVLLEHLRQQLLERSATAVASRESGASGEEDDDRRIECLARCLERLPQDERALIVGYYEGAGRAHLEERKALAGRLGLRMATLKTRAHRLRVRLKAQMDGCLAERSGR